MLLFQLFRCVLEVVTALLGQLLVLREVALTSECQLVVLFNRAFHHKFVFYFAPVGKVSSIDRLLVNFGTLSQFFIKLNFLDVIHHIPQVSSVLVVDV